MLIICSGKIYSAGLAERNSGIHSMRNEQPTAGRLNTPDACSYMDVVAGTDNAGFKYRGHNRSENLSNLLLCEEPQKG